MRQTHFSFISIASHGKTGFAVRNRPINQALTIHHIFITAISAVVRSFFNEPGTQISKIRASLLTCWSKEMNQDERYEEIETGVLVLGAAYAASLIGMIFWVVSG
jgi:seryl-tRNA(Sec) selenium transferase